MSETTVQLEFMDAAFQQNEADLKAIRTIDGFDNFLSRVGLNNDNTLSAGFYTFNLMTRNRIQLEAAYRGSWVVGQVVDCVAEDMTRAGVTVTTNEADDDIKDFQSAIRKKGIWPSLCNFIKWSRLYGGAIAIIQIRGQDLSTPLNLDRVGKNQFTGLAVFDRWQLNPILTKVITEGPDIGLPAYYQIVTTATETGPGAATANGQIMVHHSRVIRGIGIQLPFFQAITEMMWGESELERLWDRLIAFDNATMSSANLIERANNRTIGVENLRGIIAAGGKAQQGLEAQFEMMRVLQTNEGLTLMDKNDSFTTTSYTFSGLADILLQFGQQLAGASQIPLVRLFGQSPAGLNSTGESDLRMYYDSINAKQNAKLADPLDTVLRVLWRSTFGRPEPKDFEFQFVPLWQMSDKDKADIAKVKTETVIGAADAGLVSRPTAMKELRSMSGDTGIFTNITDEEIEEAELEPAPLPGGELQETPVDPLEEPVKNLDKRVYRIADKLMRLVRGRTSRALTHNKGRKSE